MRDPFQALACKPEMMKYLLRPVLRAYRFDVPERTEVGSQGSARLWWFSVIAARTHHLTIKKLEPTEVYTNDHGGPVKTWHHRLTFEPLDEQQGYQ